MRLLRANLLLIGLSLPLVVIALVGVLAPWCAPYSPTSTDLSASMQAPGSAHWLGTDQLGRDQLSRIIWAARTSISVTATVMVVSFVVGVTLGSVAAYLGGVVDTMVRWGIELALSVPAILLALALLGIRGNSVPNLILALSLVFWAPYARIARGAVLGFRGSPSADALVGLGAHPVRVLVSHVIPTAARPALVFASTDVGVVVLATASLSFLGLGVQPPTAEWGQMLVEARPYLVSAWWLALPPGIALTVVVLCSNLISEHLGLPPELRRWRLHGRGTKSIRRAGRPSARRSGEGVHAAEVPTAMAEPHPLIRATDLRIDFDTPKGLVHALRGVNYEVRRGEVLALVGESGSGKTVAMMGPLGLLGENADVRGSVIYDGAELIGTSDKELRRVRADEMAVIFQDPYAALNPLRTVGAVVTEALRPRASGSDARRRVVDLLTTVGLPRAEVVIDQYPHELSGGMKQRVLIASALASDPAVIIADEPTTSLDVTVQTEVLELLRRLVQDRDLAVIIISHDLAVVADIADRVMVMRRGMSVEEIPARHLVDEARHPYTRKLLAAVPVIGRPTGTRFNVAEFDDTDSTMTDSAGEVDWRQDA